MRSPLRPARRARSSKKPALATTPGELYLTSGVLIGLGLTGCSFTLIIPSFAKLLPESWRSLAFGAGFLGGYLAYDMIHYAVHHHVPRSRLGKKLRELHMRHHFQDDERGFGVSAPYWDRVFGTAPRPRSR